MADSCMSSTLTCDHHREPAVSSMADSSLSSTPTRRHHRELSLTPPLKRRRKRGEASERNAMDEEVPSIVFTVKGQDGRALLFRIKRNTQFIKLFTAYCEKCQVDHRSLQFFHLGQRILGKYTPDMLNLEEVNEIEVMTYVFGGACKG